MSDPTQKGLHQIALGEQWDLISALLSGADALRTQTYLPQYEAETDAAYRARSLRSQLYPGLARSIRTISGKVFAKPLTLSEDMPDLLRDWCDDFDLRGSSIDRFARTFFAKALAYGQGHILVDYVSVPQGIDAATERAIKPRPYCVHVPATSLLAVETERRGGETVVTYARILESRIKRDGYNQTRVPRVRELEPGAYRVFEQGAGGWTAVEEGAMSIGGKPLDRVPLVSLFTGELAEDYEARPPLLELAWKNLEHFQSASDQRNILTFSRFPMLACSGHTGVPDTDPETGKPKPFTLGPRKILFTPDPQGKWYYVEPNGHAIEAGRKDLDMLKEEMDALGMQLLVPKTGGQVATASAINAAEAQSDAQAMAFAMKDALDNALRLMARWAGIDVKAAGSVALNADFGLTVAEDARIKAIMDMRGRRDLSRATMYEEMQRMGVLGPDFDADEEEGRIEAEPDLLMPPGAGDPEGGDDGAGAGNAAGALA